MAALDQLDEAALRQHRIGQVEPGELILPGPVGDRQLVDQPVIQRAMILEFEGAEGMGDALDGIRLAMGEIIGRIDMPVGSGARMGGVKDAIDHRVAQVHVARGHVDLDPQRA